MEKRNILLITVDSLRWDMVSHMPNVQALAEEGSAFRRAYTNGPSTPFSFPSLFSSDYDPLSDPMRIKNPSLTEVLSDEGYRTLGVVASNPYISSISGYDAGFDRFEDYITTGGREVKKNLWTAFRSLPDILQDIRDIYRWYWKKDITSSQSGKVVTETCQDWIKTLDGDAPFFFWTHFMDTHYPYIPPLDDTDFSIGEIIRLNDFRKHRKLDDSDKSSKKLSDLKRLYLDTVKWLDHQLNQLFTFLKSQGLWNQTDILLTSDHGEAFGEHGFLGHPSQLYEENVRVPLIVKMKGTRGHEGLIDLRSIPKTLLADDKDREQGLTNTPDEDEIIPLRARHAGGRSCMKKGMNLISRPESLDYGIYGFVTERYKFIYDEESSKIELYDLKVDPEEKKEISSKKEGTVDRFMSRLKKHIS